MVDAGNEGDEIVDKEEEDVVGNVKGVFEEEEEEEEGGCIYEKPILQISFRTINKKLEKCRK